MEYKVQDWLSEEVFEYHSTLDWDKERALVGKLADIIRLQACGIDSLQRLNKKFGDPECKILKGVQTGVKEIMDAKFCD